MLDRATLPDPVATGLLSQKPLAHLLAYTLDRKLGGTLELANDPRQNGLISFVQGKVSRVWTSEPVIYLGHVLYEAGAINDAQLGASLAEVAKSKALHGQVLLAHAMVDLAHLSNGLRQQRLRKLHHLFSFPPETKFAFYIDREFIPERPNDVEPADPLPAIWRGLVANPSSEHVRATMGVIGARPIRVTGQFDHQAFREAERAAIHSLRHLPNTVEELATHPGMDGHAAEMLAYFLMITKLGEFAVAGAVPDPPASSPSVGGSGEYPRKVSFSMRAPGLGQLPTTPAGKASYPPSGPIDHAPTSVRSPASARPAPVSSRPISSRPGDPVFRSSPPTDELPPASVRPRASHPPSVAPEPNADADRLIEEAEMNFVLNERHKALNVVRQALALSPKMPAGVVLLAALEASNVKDGEEDKLKNIIQRMDTIIRDNPDCRRGRYYRGMLKKRMGEYDSAIVDLKEAVARDPDDMEAKRELRICELKEKETAKKGGSLLDRLRGR
jgi:hypothetical protein